MDEPKLFSAERRLQRRKLYSSGIWKRTRAKQIDEHPFCALCEKQGKRVKATVCDHIDPFWPSTVEGLTAGPFQSLCRECHQWKISEDVHKMIKVERTTIRFIDI